jgi:5-formyltetrahydrofolate cyclo-ligase
MERILEKSRAVESRLFETSWWREAHTLFCFVSLPREVQTIGIRRRAHSEGMTVALPRVVGDQIRFHRVAHPEEPLVRSALNIEEPSPELPYVEPSTILPGAVDRPAAALVDGSSLVLVPGLAFDRRRYRLGRGRGFYDRFLGQWGRTIRAVGLCFEEQLVEVVPHERWDMRMDAVLTDAGET